MRIDINKIQVERLYRIAQCTKDGAYKRFIRVRPTNNTAEFIATDCCRAVRTHFATQDINYGEYYLPASLVKRAQQFKLEEFSIELTEEEARIKADGVALWESITEKQYPKIDYLFWCANSYNTHATIHAKEREIIRACRALERRKPAVDEAGNVDYGVVLKFGDNETIIIEHGGKTILTLEAAVNDEFKAIVDYRYLADALRLSNNHIITLSGDMAGEEFSLKPVRIFSSVAESLIMTERAVRWDGTPHPAIRK